MVDEHKVDYVQVDEKKTQALQSTRLEWTASRRPESGEEKSLLRPEGKREPDALFFHGSMKMSTTPVETLQ